MVERDGTQLCDGTYAGSGGDLKGHYAPGVAMILWGLHWLQGSFRLYFSNPDCYKSQASYGLPGFPAWPVEGLLKMGAALVGGFLELTFRKRDGYTRLLCKPGTLREGRFNASVHNWQHFAIYPGFFISGAVDLLLYFLDIPLPDGGEKVFLGLAFFNEGLLMLLHEKHNPLSQNLHQALAFAMLATAFSVWAEAVTPQSFVPTMCRVTSTLSQGIIFFLAGNLVFGGPDGGPNVPKWDQAGNLDQAPAQYASVAIAQAVSGSLGVCALTLVLFSRSARSSYLLPN